MEYTINLYRWQGTTSSYIARSLEDLKNEIIQEALNHNKGDVVKTAKSLKIGKSTIYRLLKENKIKTYALDETNK